MIRFVVKKKGVLLDVETIDIIVPQLERLLQDNQFTGDKFELVGIKKLPSCDICFDPKCQSDHK